MNIDYKLIGDRIRTERKRKDITQESLAEKLDVTIGYVSQVERGITKISLDLLGKISSILECDIATLVTGSVPNDERYITDEIHNEAKRLSPKKKKMLLEIIKLFNDYE